jgi:hypothetical protein
MTSGEIHCGLKPYEASASTVTGMDTTGKPLSSPSAEMSSAVKHRQAIVAGEYRHHAAVLSSETSETGLRCGTSEPGTVTDSIPLSKSPAFQWTGGFRAQSLCRKER